jgi:hypothetical protein
MIADHENYHRSSLNVDKAFRLNANNNIGPCELSQGNLCSFFFLSFPPLNSQSCFALLFPALDTKRGRRLRSGEGLEICCYGR